MGKLRVHVLAKELGISSGELMEKLKADGMTAVTASSSVDDDVVARYRKELGVAAPAESTGAPVGSTATPARPAGPPSASAVSGGKAKAPASAKAPPSKKPPEKG